MSEVLIVQDLDLVKILNEGTYDPLIYLNTIDGRPATPQSKKAMYEIPEWIGAITAYKADELALVDTVITPNMLIKATEVFFIHDAFSSQVVTGVVFNVSMIISCINYIIDNYIGEDPEGTVYIWCPLNYKFNVNYDEFLTALNVLSQARNRDIVLLIDKMFYSDNYSYESE